MQAFTPTPPPTPTPEHLALITEALCARAVARNHAAASSTQKRRLQFQHELSLLRNPVKTRTPPRAVNTPPNNPLTGPAAVLSARLARIVPQVHAHVAHVHVAPPEQEQEQELEVQARVDAYHARMSRYFHAPVVSSAPKARVGTRSAYKQPKPLDVEHVLPPAPVRPAIPSARVAPMIAAHHEVTEDETAPGVEEVKRPSLVDAVVRAFSRFVDRITEKEEDKERKPDGVALGAGAAAASAAAAQALAVFTSLGKH